MNGNFACTTKSGVWFFKVTSSGLEKKRGLMRKNKEVRIPMVCIAHSEEDRGYFSGDTDGFLYTWEEMGCVKRVKLHQTAVMAVSWREGKIYSSDNTTLIVSNYLGEVTKSIKIPSYAKSIDAINDKIVIGTKCGKIMTF